MRKIIWIGFGIIIVSTMLIPVAYRVYMDVMVMPDLKHSSFKADPKIKERMLTDLKHLSKQDLFSDITYEKNANALIKKYVSWHGEGISHEKSPQEKKLEELFASIEGMKLEISEKVKKIEGHPLFKQIDVTWMKDLKDYDHWNFFETPYIKKKFLKLEGQNSLRVIGFLASYPTPDFMEFLNYAVIRFLKKQKHDRDQAYRDFQYSLKLLHSQGTLVAQMLAARGLAYAVEFKKKFPIQGHESYTPATQTAYRRVAWGWAALLSQDFSAAIPVEMEPFMKPRFGVCAGATERAMGETLFVDLTRKSYWPFEHNFEKAKTRQFSLRSQLFEVCHMDLFKTLLRRKPVAVYSNEVFGPSHTNETVQNRGGIIFDVGRVPYLRRVVWGMMTSLPSPGYTQYYEDGRFEPLDVDKL